MKAGLNVKPAVVALVASLTVSAISAAEEAAVKFTQAPTARKVGEKVLIEFVVSRPTDVAVWVLDAKGAPVRHLAAGMLGANAPAPLKADSLAQGIAWDGTDDLGEPAKGGPFAVRVAAGLTARNAGYMFEEENPLYQYMGLPLGIGVARDGSAYVIRHLPTWYASGPTGIIRLTADGAYAGTVMPLASSLERQYTKGFPSVVDGKGRVQIPLQGYMSPNSPYEPNLPVMQTPAVRSNGNLLMLSTLTRGRGNNRGLGIIELRPVGGTWKLCIATPICFRLFFDRARQAALRGSSTSLRASVIATISGTALSCAVVEPPGLSRKSISPCFNRLAAPGPSLTAALASA